jgi:four helix bundle protein
MRNYRRLTVISKADMLLDSVEVVTAALPHSDRHVLIEQMRRAALSVGSNIAEGAGRISDADFERFLGIAAGSASELQYQLSVARRRGCPDDLVRPAEELADEVKGMLYGLIRASRRRRG